MDLSRAFEILEIDETAPLSEVERAYKDLASVWHPDRHPNNSRLLEKSLQKMKELNAAHDLLSDFYAEQYRSKPQSQYAKEEFTIVTCKKCGTKNRVQNIDDVTFICGKCRNNLFTEQTSDDYEERILCADGACIGILRNGRCTTCGKTIEEVKKEDEIRTKTYNEYYRRKEKKASPKTAQPKKSPLQSTKLCRIRGFVLFSLILAVLIGILVTPKLMRKDFSSLINAEAQKTKILKKQHEDRLAAKKASFEEDLAAIDSQDLRRRATKNYEILFEARKSFDKKFALSLREKAQLRMRDLSSDSTKSLHDAIRSVAKEASPIGTSISVQESAKGIALHIDFDMSSMTSGEHGTRTKHRTKDSLRKEVVSLISRVTNDIFQFCRGLNISKIYVGCRHYVTTSYPDGSERENNLVLYKIRIQKSQIPQFTNDPFLNIYSTTKHFKVNEDNFDKIEIEVSRK